VRPDDEHVVGRIAARCLELEGERSVLVKEVLEAEGTLNSSCMKYTDS
jgi:hypothetical protein